MEHTFHPQYKTVYKIPETIYKINNHLQENICPPKTQGYTSPSMFMVNLLDLF